MTAESTLYIGMISGTSADGIDCVLVDFSVKPLRLIHQITWPLPAALRESILQLMVPTDNEIDRFGVLDQHLGEVLAAAVRQLLNEAKVDGKQVRAIGSHGQTLRHRPPGELERAFTLQIGDPNVIAETTGITTVADLRRRDMAVGGQGAPLVPAFHSQVFKSDQHDRVIVNIGGIGNITLLPRDGDVLGFDTGPGNCLMDGWILRHHQQAYDRNGSWAASGTANANLLRALLMHPYFSVKGPKSTGREMFTMAWLDSVLTDLNPIAPVDVQATLLQLTSTSIANHILDLKLQADADSYICGGGAHNDALMKQLQQQLRPLPVASSDKLGLGPDWVEACAFAWLAQQTVNHQAGNLPSVTGARRAVILGGLYFAA